MSDALDELRALRQVIDRRKGQARVIEKNAKAHHEKIVAWAALEVYDAVILDINRAIARLRADATTA